MPKQTDLGNRYAESALLAKRAALLGEIEALKKQIAWRENQLEHVQGTLQMFGLDADDAKPIKHYKRIPLFKQGELCRLVRDALRTGKKPMSCCEVTQAVSKKLGHGETVYPAMYRRVSSSLAYMWRDRREVLKDGNHVNVRWRLR